MGDKNPYSSNKPAPSYRDMQSQRKEQPAKTAFFFLVVYIMIVFIRPQAFVPAVLDWPLIPITLVLSFLLWSTSDHKSLDAPQFILLTLLFMFAPVTVAAANQGMSHALDAFIELVPPYLTFLLIATTALSHKRIHIMMWLVVGGAVLMSAHGIQQIHSGVGWTGETAENGRMRYIDIFNDPNDVGLSLIVAIPMAAYLFRHYKPFMLKLLMLACIGTILYGIKLTDSRGTVLALGAVLGMYSWRKYGVFKTLFISMLALPVLFLASTRLDTIDPGEESAYRRVDAWYEGIHMLADNPIFGVGYRLFTEFHDLTAHNSYILVFAEMGIPGYFLWFSFFGTCIMAMYLLQKTAKKTNTNPAWRDLAYNMPQKNTKPTDTASSPDEGKKTADDQAIAKVLLLSLIGFATAAFFLSRSYAMPFFILCGMATAHYQGTRLRKPSIPPYRFLEHFWFWAFLSGSSVIVLYLIVRILLSIV